LLQAALQKARTAYGRMRAVDCDDLVLTSKGEFGMHVRVSIIASNR
jgi:hypothetical protein